jgi:peroxiredoxin
MFPHERSLVKKLEGKPFVLLGVNSDPDKTELKKALEKDKITWRSFWDQTTSGPIATAWDIHGWPSLFVIDEKGVIRHKWVGSPGEEVMDKAIEELVKAAEGGK